jgi:hypothetical protein
MGRRRKNNDKRVLHVVELETPADRVRHQFAWDETRIREDGRSRIGSCQVVFSDESRFAKNADRQGQYEKGAFA